MKYLKLYENFNNNIEDTLEDIKWVLIEMVDSYELLGHEKDYCMLYEVSNEPSKEDLESAVGRLQDIGTGYELVYVGNSPRRDITHTLAKACWIVKSEFCKEWSPLPVVNSGKIPTMEDNPIFEDIQKNILLKMWEQESAIDNDRLKALGIYKYSQIQKVCAWFREYLGPKANQIMDSIFRSKGQAYQHHIEKGGYDFEIEVLSYEIDKYDEISITCKILPGGEVSIIMDDGRTLDLKDAVNDKEIGWEIKGEINDCIEDYFYSELQIRNKTGYNITIEYTF